MQMNPAYFANKVVQHLTQCGVDATIDDADTCRINVKDKTHEPLEHESPARMAGRIKLAHISGAERLRAIVCWIDYHQERFNDLFTFAELAQLWQYGQLNSDTVPEFADTWTQEQIIAAVGVRVDASGMSDTLLSLASVLDADPRDVSLTWDDATDESDTEPGRIVDVIIGGRFRPTRPTRATWQKLIDAGLPMCSWQEASESWDLEAAK